MHLLLLFQDEKAGFELETLNVSKKFQDIRDEIVLQYGYDRFETKRGGRNSTQEEFTAKTLKQCDSKSALRNSRDKVQWSQAVKVRKKVP